MVNCSSGNTFYVEIALLSAFTLRLEVRLDTKRCGATPVSMICSCLFQPRWSAITETKSERFRFRTDVNVACD
ncbi:hypothetical protein J6590_052730 [Homalodisca vitripennis]|nr:hypothetical protein J6590_052730 [Homalodisca vitripennis]